MTCGVVYVAFGERYQAEARRSLRSLQKVSALPIAVVTEAPWTESPQPSQFIIREPLLSLRCKPVAIPTSPFARSLFVDTDTVFASDPEPVFGLLDHYDIGVRFGGAWLGEADGLAFHSQCNSGVILFKKRPEVTSLFADWLRLYDEAATLIPNPNDQRYLAIAIGHSRARPVHLGSFMNFALFETILTEAPPIIYHGRAQWIETLARKVNATWDRKTDWQARVWSPNIAGFLPRGVRRSDPVLALALLLRRVFNEIRLRLIRSSDRY